MDGLNDAEQKIADEAYSYVTKNEKQINEKIASEARYKAVDSPVAMFMAGAPGAGKTEFSKSLVRTFVDPSADIVRIDPDEIRSELPGYNGQNAYLFQRACTKAVFQVVHHALRKKQHFILDGTLANHGIARTTIADCIKKKRKAWIVYVYQDPLASWEFTKSREKVEGRHIDIDSFIRRFLDSKKTVKLLKNEFGDDVKIMLVIKDYKTGEATFQFGIDNIDSYLDQTYDEGDLRRIIL